MQDSKRDTDIKNRPVDSVGGVLKLEDVMI